MTTKNQISLHFNNVYKMADLVEECARQKEWFGELNWDEDCTLNALVKPSKITIMAQYIYAVISVESRYEYRKNADFYEDLDSVTSPARNLENDLSTYSIPFRPIDDFRTQLGFNEDDEWFYEWYLSQEEQFELLWERLTDEVFHLLFANRSFLINFNVALADFLQNKNPPIPSKYLKNGRISRATHIPQWLKRAVFYRDYGKCVLCQKDISGLLGTDRKLHYDHIVPINSWGTNDPSNFQLLCETCNLNKSDKPAKTNHLYHTWWDY